MNRKHTARPRAVRVHASRLLLAGCLAIVPLVAHGDALDAMRHEAQQYEHGEGVPKDPFRAIELYCEAARQGDAKAQYELGWMYANGRGVDRNESIAAAYFRLAANQGLAQAGALLAHLPAPGDLPQCISEAVPVVNYDDHYQPFDAVLQPSTVAQDTWESMPGTPAQENVMALLRTIAPEYDVNPMLALAFIRAESNFDAAAHSPKGAQGLMQLIPETSARFNVRRPYDPIQNIRGGLAYIRWLLAYFQGNVPLVAAAYNAGEGAVDRYRGIPPYAETRRYVRRILSFFRGAAHPYDPAVTNPSPELARMRLIQSDLQ